MLWHICGSKSTTWRSYATRGWLQVIRLGGRHLYLMRRLASLQCLISVSTLDVTHTSQFKCLPLQVHHLLTHVLIKVNSD